MHLTFNTVIVSLIVVFGILYIIVSVSNKKKQKVDKRPACPPSQPLFQTVDHSESIRKEVELRFESKEFTDKLSMIINLAVNSQADIIAQEFASIISVGTDVGEKLRNLFQEMFVKILKEGEFVKEAFHELIGEILDEGLEKVEGKFFERVLRDSGKLKKLLEISKIYEVIAENQAETNTKIEETDSKLFLCIKEVADAIEKLRAEIATKQIPVRTEPEAESQEVHNKIVDRDHIAQKKADAVASLAATLDKTASSKTEAPETVLEPLVEKDKKEETLTAFRTAEGKCSMCDDKIGAEDVFCGNCGSKIVLEAEIEADHSDRIVKCPNCGEECVGDEQYCPNCNALLIEGAKREVGKSDKNAAEKTGPSDLAGQIVAKLSSAPTATRTPEGNCSECGTPLASDAKQCPICLSLITQAG